MSDIKKVAINIDNQEFILKSKKEEEYIKALTEYINENIEDIKRKNYELSSSMVYILSCYNLADEYFESRRELLEYKEETEEPLMNYEKNIKILEQLKEEHYKLKSNEEKIKDELIEVRREVEILRKKTEEQEQTIKIKNNQIENNEDIIKDLQEKIFNEQMEKMNLKKELKNL